MARDPMHASVALVGLLLFASSLPTGTSQMIELPGSCRIVNARDADAIGSGAAARLREAVTRIDQSFGLSDVYQDGPGKRDDADTGIAVRQPPDSGTTARVGALTSDVHASVTLDAKAPQPLIAHQRSVANAADVNLLNGMITASTVKAAADARATTNSAVTNADGSTLQNVRVNGKTYTDVAPNTRVDLPNTVGTGSYVILFERIDNNLFPGPGSPVYRANVTVRMVHVFVSDAAPSVPGAQAVEIVVAEATSYAQAPVPFCGAPQYVDANAYVARLSPTVVIGSVDISATGGVSEQRLARQEVKVGDAMVVTGASETRAAGTVTAGTISKASAVAKVYDLCVEIESRAGCAISADFIRAESNSRANATKASHWGLVVIADMKILGVDVCKTLGLTEPCRPPQGTKISVNGVTITFNRQIGDPPQPGHTGVYVRAVKIEAPGINEVIIGRAYTEAFFEPPRR